VQRETLRPGDVVITGGVTVAVPVERADVVEATLVSNSVTVRLHRLRAGSTRLGGAPAGRLKSRPPHHSWM
jgi:2-keto-4-pentenoate hydratase/2-oxohepta-3-ene-1,7-dioic acid hydratase in catechol pathway